MSRPKSLSYWTSPILMVTFFVLAVLAALGHHLLYKSLVGKTPVNRM